MNQTDQMPDMSLDTANLVREDTFSDGRVGTIRRLTPVKADGSDDPARTVSYSGHTQIMTQAGALPLAFEIEADNLEQAVEKFPELAKQALEEMIQRIEEMRRDAATSIVTPDQGGFGGMGGGQGGGFGGGGPTGGIRLK
ncbi:MAG: hypothetical protein JJU06_20480 [Ectothiorhodospiraceae bacterium]|nr:hypothetical protein [Ectothiorhodospiraceae bacterium]MCH8505838.1 hypothetical protein [Ectothiorhodospiraceae bacterium]